MAKQQKHTNDLALDTARAIAKDVVRERFPDLQGIEPQVSQAHPRCLHPADAQRLGLLQAPTVPASIEYTFTFSRKLRTPDGYAVSRVARITVDTDQHTVRAVESK